jgi:hypothetical protein
MRKLQDTKSVKYGFVERLHRFWLDVHSGSPSHTIDGMAPALRKLFRLRRNSASGGLLYMIQ